VGDMTKVIKPVNRN